MYPQTYNFSADASEPVLARETQAAITNCVDLLNDNTIPIKNRSQIYEYLADLYSDLEDLNSANYYANLSIFSDPTSTSAHRKKKALVSKDKIPDRQFSVVIPSYNRCSDLMRCIETIRDNTRSPVNIIVVCDKCNDGTVAFIQNENAKDDFIGIVNDERLGSVASIRVGLYAALGDYVAIINDDVEVMPGWDIHILKTIDADDRAGCAVPLVVNPDGTAQSVGQHNPYRSTRYHWIGQVPAEDHQTAVGRNLFDFPHFHSSRECDYGYFPVLKRECLEQIGFVDDVYQHYYVDPDIGYLVQSCGLRNIYCPTSVFVHHHKSIDELGNKGVQEKAKPDLIHFVQKWGLTLRP